MTHRILGSVDEQIHEFLLLGWFDGKNVNQGDEFIVFADCGHMSLGSEKWMIEFGFCLTNHITGGGPVV